MWGFITIWLLVHVGLGSKSSIALDGFGRCHHICRLIYTYIHTYNIYNIIHRFVCLNIILCVRYIYIYIWMNILYIYYHYEYIFRIALEISSTTFACARAHSSCLASSKMDSTWSWGWPMVTPPRTYHQRSSMLVLFIQSHWEYIYVICYMYMYVRYRIWNGDMVKFHGISWDFMGAWWDAMLHHIGFS